MSLGELVAGYARYIGEDIAKHMKPTDWKAAPLSTYANTDKEWPVPEQDY